MSESTDVPNLTAAQEAYLEYFSRRGHHANAAAAAKVHPRTARRWRQPGQPSYSPTFEIAYAEARDLAREYLGDCAIEQATDAEKPNHVVLLRLLEAYDPAFRQKRDLNLSGSVETVTKRIVLAGPEIAEDPDEDAD